MKAMSIIGIVWFSISLFFIIVFLDNNSDASAWWALLGLLYALPFAITVLVKSNQKQKTKRNAIQETFTLNEPKEIGTFSFMESLSIKRSEKENYVIKGNIGEVRTIILQALQVGNFTKIADNRAINQISANYKKMTVYGNIKITLEEEDHTIKVNAVATANVDNVYAIRSSPMRKMLNMFKENIPPDRILEVTTMVEIDRNPFPAYIALSSALLVIVGCFMPWKQLGNLTLNRGIDTLIGVLMLLSACSGVALAVYDLSKNENKNALCFFIIGILGGLNMLYVVSENVIDFFDIFKINLNNFNGTGFYVVISGFIGFIIAYLVGFSKKIEVQTSTVKNNA